MTSCCSLSLLARSYGGGAAGLLENLVGFTAAEPVVVASAFAAAGVISFHQRGFVAVNITADEKEGSLPFN